jgi:hypothetical protein
MNYNSGIEYFWRKVTILKVENNPAGLKPVGFVP